MSEIESEIEKVVDCALMQYQAEKFLLPTAAMAELIPLAAFEKLTQATSNHPAWVGEFVWQNLPLPVLSLNSKPLLHTLHHPKIAILHAMFKTPTAHPPFFAVLFEEIPHRVSVKASAITWIDENKKIAKLTMMLEEATVILFDLVGFSHKVENIFLERNLNI